jgi:hypothetical protein
MHQKVPEQMKITYSFQIREVEGKLQQDMPRCASPAPASCPAGGAPASNMAVVPQDDMPVCKVAERVVLRKMDNTRQITGSQLATYGASRIWFFVK